MSETLPFNGITGLHANGDYEMTYNAAGDLVRDHSRGVLRTQWNADGHPSQYDLEGGHRHRLGWDNTGNHLYTSYETSVTTVSAGQLAGRTRRTALRAYTGDGHVLCGGEGNSIADSIEMIRFDGGYFDADLVPHYYIADYLDSNIAVVDADGDLVQTATYYPYGEPHRNPLIRRGIYVSTSPPADAATAAEPRTTNLTQNEMRTANPYLYGDKEWMYQDGLREYVYGARMHVPSLPRFSSIDPLAEKHPEQTPYLFCAANPIRYVDPDGKEWKYVDDKDSKDYNTFVWVDSKEAYDKDGKLLPGYYIQAISFSEAGEKGSFNPDSEYNIGTSTATVYKADGTTEEFNACTNPSKSDKYATVPAGRYEAKVGKHKGDYTALRIGDVGTKNFNANTIELGQSNPSNKSTTKAVGINIHKPGKNNFTGIDSKNRAISMGCLLIDRKRWNDFIKIFSDYSNSIIGVIVKR